MESKKEEIYVQELYKIQETSDKIQEFKETSDRIQETSEQNRKISMLFFDEFLKLITGNKFKRDLIESIKIDIENNLNIEIIFSNIIFVQIVSFGIISYIFKYLECIVYNEYSIGIYIF